jgi:hypothetical protein
MLSLICRKAEPAQSKKTDDNDLGLISYRRLQTLDIEGLEDLLLESPEHFSNTLLTQVGMLDESTASFSALVKAILDESSDSDAVAQLFDYTTCAFDQLEEMTPSLWAKMLLSDRVKMKPEAVWRFFKDVFIPALEEKGCETFDMEAFASFIQRHAQELRDVLWDDNFPIHHVLQSYLLGPSGLSNETLTVLFAKTVLDDPLILKGLESRERWEMLISATFLAFSPEIRSAVHSFSADLEAPYLVAHWAQARGQIELSQLTLDVVLAISKSRVSELDEKMNMWASLPPEFIRTSNEAIEEIARVCGLANQRSSSFPPTLIPELKNFVSREGLTPDQRSEMLIQCLPSYNWSESASALVLLGDGFSKLSPAVKKIEVPYSDLNMRLVIALQAKGFVQTVTQKGDLISATAKPKGMVLSST